VDKVDKILGTMTFCCDDICSVRSKDETINDTRYVLQGRLVIIPYEMSEGIWTDIFVQYFSSIVS